MKIFTLTTRSGEQVSISEETKEIIEKIIFSDEKPKFIKFFNVNKVPWVVSVDQITMIRLAWNL